MDIKNRIIELAKNIPLKKNDGSSNHWDMVCQDIRNKVINEDIENFLNWYNVVETMFVNSKDVANYEYNVLSKSDKWPIYQEALKGLWPGNPKPSTLLPFTNNNALHQLYHLHMYESKYGSILNAKQIVEFGGGYGCLCSIIRKMGFKGQYIIIDFPIFHLLQKYYLNSLGIWDTIQTSTPNTTNFQDSTLFAFWSLSETDPTFRQNFIDNNFSYLKNFLVSYQVAYESYDNTHFFNSMKSKNDFNYSEVHIEHIPQNYYLFGDKK